MFTVCSETLRITDAILLIPIIALTAASPNLSHASISAAYVIPSWTL